MCARVASVLIALVMSVSAPQDADACGVKLSFKVANRAKAKPIARSGERTAIAGKDTRTPIAAGPKNGVRSAKGTVLVAAKPQTEPDKDPAPAAAAVTTTAKPSREVVTARPTPTPKPAPKPAKIEKEPPPAPVEPPVVAKTDPAPKPAVVKPAAVPGVLGEVHFTFNASGVPGSSQGTINRVAKWLAAHPDTRISVEGHADPVGPADVNDAISRQRAEAVKQALVDAGVDGSRIDTAGFGFSRLKYSASDSRNRRVEILPIK